MSEAGEPGVLGAPAGDPAAAPEREARPSPAQGEGRSRVVLAGATGYIGRPLTSLLHVSGHQVTVLTRNAGQAGGLAPGVETVQWDGRTASGSWTAALEGAQAIVNLSGANIGAQRWSEERKEELLRSRLEPAAAIAEALKVLPAERRPKVLVGASGIDYYGDRGDEEVTEESPPGDSFLARLCVQWEAAHRAAEPLGLRVASVRTAVVLGRDADVVKRLALPFRLFAGGPIGSGKQWFSWIHLDDVVALYRQAVENGEAQGPLNAVAPDARRMKDVAREVGRVLGRPSWAPAPAFALKLVLGDQADLVLHGRRAVPRKAQALGFQYKYPDLPGALAQALGGS